MALRRSAWTKIRGDVCRDVNDEFHENIDVSIHLQDHGLEVAYVPSMISGMSARRLEDPPRKYRDYVKRFERTYAAHAVEGSEYVNLIQDQWGGLIQDHPRPR